jgi:hypothetical protein
MRLSSLFVNRLFRADATVVVDELSGKRAGRVDVRDAGHLQLQELVAGRVDDLLIRDPGRDDERRDDRGGDNKSP